MEDVLGLKDNDAQLSALLLPPGIPTEEHSWVLPQILHGQPRSQPILTLQSCTWKPSSQQFTYC